MTDFAAGQSVRIVRLPREFYTLRNLYDRRPSAKLRSRKHARERLEAYEASRGQVFTIKSVEKCRGRVYLEVEVNGVDLTFTPSCLAEEPSI